MSFSNNQEEEHDLFGASLEELPEDEPEQTDLQNITLWKEAGEPYLLAEPLPSLSLVPRVYQQEAVDAWEFAGGRGMIVLPTGAGKTVTALMACHAVQTKTLVVVPTIDLMHQWHRTLTDQFQLPSDAVGRVGGGFKALQPITVITYDSAAMPTRDLSSFGLLVFDEVHHLPSSAYRTIAKRAPAPFRLGLSATLERSDGRHTDLLSLIGPVVFERQPAILAQQKHIAEYKAKRISVDLTDNEQMEYEQLTSHYAYYFAANRRKLMMMGCGNLFEALIRKAGHDPAARAALQAHREARMIAMNASAKIQKVEELLTKHAEDKVIVFSEWNSIVREISRRLTLPSITFRTQIDERRDILEKFRQQKYSKLVTGRVLNEGVDVPDANVAIVVSGSSSTREYIQRLGRVLRPKPGHASLYEIVTRGTSEVKTARKRKPVEKLIEPAERRL